MNRKEASSNVLYDMSRMLVPKDFLEFFEIVEIKELHSCWQVILHERTELTPEALKEFADVVLDGYCNPIEILSHSFSLKPIYLVLKRRRWKRSGTDAHFSNEYGIQETSAKLTKDMAGFIKKK